MSSHSLPVDSDAADSRWHELADLLDELALTAKSPLTAEAFYRQLLARLVPIIGASGGAIWTGRGTDELRLESQVNLAVGQAPKGGEVLGRHQALVEEVLRAGEPRSVPPGAGATAGSPSSAAGSDTETSAAASSYWLIFHPFQSATAPGVIELLARGESSPAEARELARILGAVVELVEDFHRHGELRHLRARAAAWRAFDAFAQSVHQSLDVEQTAFLIANDGCRVIGCQRASVLVRHGAKFRAMATSGVDALERRAKIVRRLEQLATRCAAGGEPVWYYDGAPPLADEIERPLAAYLDESHARQLAVVPLSEPRAAADDRPPRVIGVLVAEQFEGSAAPEVLRERVAAISPHAATALSNALVHSRLPLARVGRVLAAAGTLVEARRLPKTLLAAGAIAAAVAALVFIPAAYNVEAQGEFQPAVRREVFAADDGVVRELLVEHGAAVSAGQPLLVLRNPELDLEFRRLAGEMQTAAKKLAAVEAERLQSPPARDDDARRDARKLAAEEEELKELLAGLRRQRTILEEQQQALTLRSPIDGQVLSWNIQETLEARPVERGQALLTVGDLAGPWVLEVHVPDDRAGAVLGERERLQPDLEVSFVLASEPGKVHRGRIAEMALATELDEASEPTVLVTVAFDKHDVAGLRPGGTAQAKIHCGQRSLGYVWLSDLYHYVQSLWW